MSQSVIHEEQGSEDSSVVEQGKALVQEQAQRVRGAAGEKVGQRVEAGSKQLGEQLLEIVGGLTRTSHDLRSEGKEQPAAVLDAITQRAEGVGTYLTQARADRMLHDFEHLGRRRPWIAIAGGMAIGFVASRFLKASSSRRFTNLRSQGYSSGKPWPSSSQGSLPSPSEQVGLSHESTSS